MNLFFEDFTESVPPSSKFLCWIQNVIGKFLKLVTKFLYSRMVVKLRVIVRWEHFNEWRLFSSWPESLISSQCSNNHLCNSVEDSSFPINIIRFHFISSLGVSLNSTFLNTLQIHIANVLIVFDKFTKNFDSMRLKELLEFIQVHRCFSVKVNLSNNNSILNVKYLLLNILCMLEYSTFDFLKFIDFFGTFSDVFRYWQREPIVILYSFVHPLI